jgi:uncharacterized protein YhbP (UPF0306 family)
MTLAVSDEQGPWAADVIYIFDDDLTLYWMSDPQTRHSKAIAEQGLVAAAITVSGQGEMNLGIQLAGRAEKIEGSRHDLALKHYAKRKKPEPEERQDVLGGDAWYRLVPQQLYLIDEESFGFERQQVI